MHSGSKSAWKAHENQVAALYELLGYRVTTNINVDGQQSDLLCTKWVSGAGETVLYVDAKYTALRPRSYVSKDMVDQFVASFRSRKDVQGWTAGIMLSNRPFTQYAKAAAAPHHDIFLKTLQELYDDIFLLRPYLHTTIRGYEEGQTFTDFIPLRCAITYAERQGFDEHVTTEKLDDYVDHWLLLPEYPQLCILGDFGSGKTTFLRHLHYKLAKAYLETPERRMPFFIQLRDYYNTRDLPDLMDRFFSLELGAKVPWHIFQEFLRSGKLLFLLDGFDEMGLATESTSRMDSYRKLAPLLTDNSKVVITCRPAYFPSSHELSRVFSFARSQISIIPLKHSNPTIAPATASIARLLTSKLHKHEKHIHLRRSPLFEETLYLSLKLFDKQQITAYLEKHERTISDRSRGQLDSSLLLARIDEIYDLEDLAKRPILLKLIVLTLPSFKQNPDKTYSVPVAGQTIQVKQVTAWSLYYVYTEEELSREYRKSLRWDLERPILRQIIAAIAFKMLQDDVATVQLDQLASVIKEVVNADLAHSETIVTSVHTCSFFVRDADNYFRFTHKSFMEFYAAHFLLALFMDDYNLASGVSLETARSILAARLYPEEVLYFLGYAFVDAPPELTTSVHRLFDKFSEPAYQDRSFQSNVINLLNYAGRPPSIVTGVNIDAVIYQKTRCETVTYEACTLGDVRLVRAQIAKLRMSRSAVRRLLCTDCSRIQIALVATSCEQLQIGDVDTNFEIKECTIGGIDISGSRLSGKITASVLSFSRSCGGTLDGMIFEDVLILSADRDQQFITKRMKGTVFRRCVFLNIDCGGGFPYWATFEECIFINCYRSAYQGLEHLHGSRGVFVSKNIVRDTVIGADLVNRSNMPKLVEPRRARSLASGKETPISWEENLLTIFPIVPVPGMTWSLAEVRRRLDGINES